MPGKAHDRHAGFSQGTGPQNCRHGIRRRGQDRPASKDGVMRHLEPAKGKPMINSSRRTFLGASALLPLAATGVRAASPAGKTIEADLLRYVRFGNKRAGGPGDMRSEEHTSELQSLMRISYAVSCLKKKNTPRH